MKNVDDLIDDAAALADRGLSRGEIADELNVSRETASWLVERADTNASVAATDTDDSPRDVHVDWSTIGEAGARLSAIGIALADALRDHSHDVDLVVGIEKAGVPLATATANELGTDLATYTPRKHQWDEGDMADLGGSFSRNFASVEDRDCFVVDDTVTSGTTITETIQAVREAGGTPVACGVLADKQGLGDVDGTPIEALLQVIRVGSGDD
ncbi:transcriptional regulator GfcR [Halobacterium salinarum]|uniref:Transcriptional regulator GfcR n=5 Tax=Halobacterium salinarum TaxID=2242 RepID=GFCR_HALSA|nr:transcriptional regulator GfcR [Halobacterium salinarum]B0R3D9.1 RecName: Full=PyrE-like protein [Halobacterium salinarum R1]Q9HS16.1 RecName: Full=PyrE-like protein [Halobacterium salinarum NRC-1]AAG18992.1 aspartate carbamoyltransferase catalytic subunit [Halobacterium salinarum NRC-1]MBB6089825.1 orotate phosphoribosyltransferase [Halobacterium salinarum]MDL0120540.1 orotate phosphoribosyltransferase-like protein [Halobacterium salinarum]MDL0125248.1 orotate phosphoribosyltransferase-li